MLPGTGENGGLLTENGRNYAFLTHFLPLIFRLFSFIINHLRLEKGEQEGNGPPGGMVGVRRYKPGGCPTYWTGDLREIANNAEWILHSLSISIVRLLAVIFGNGLVDSCGHPILPRKDCGRMGCPADR